ncbi:MAG: glycoside hydrolase family 32 protein, partial [Bacteroidetes bacterium]|nr:glycoside hydrolase family 32 protein [Bacteroidota bacterium]
MMEKNLIFWRIIRLVCFWNLFQLFNILPMSRFFVLFLLFFGLYSCDNSNQETDTAATSQEENTEIDFSNNLRPQYHFSQPANWMNDPNGMVFYEGTWHLFYQYFPRGMQWGPMHWGHASSQNLFEWEHLPIALYPDDSLGYIFSGSAVVDWNNTAGFQEGDKPPLVAIFTQHLEDENKKVKQVQSIAYSNDAGKTWTKAAENPVLANPAFPDFRDPKVIWYEPENKWIMALAVADRIHFYSSPNLKDWTFESEFGQDYGAHGGVWECPDLFPLPLPGNADSVKWCLLVSLNPGHINDGSGTQYFLGDFDGKTFTCDDPKEQTLWLDYGRDNYAGVTWSDAPNDRRVFLGWMNNWNYGQETPTEGWRGAMTLPRGIKLQQTDFGLRIFSNPVKEVEHLRKSNYKFAIGGFNGKYELTEDLGFDPAVAEYMLAVEASEEVSAETVGFEWSNDAGEVLRIGFERKSNRFFIDRRNSGQTDFHENFAPNIDYAPRTAPNRTVIMRVFMDRSS